PGIGLDADGFDLAAGGTWIYPTNFPLRDYQFNIVKNALFKNTLVSLPTGLGKTFIAAVVMYNFYRWYPQCKIMFLAPTKPLVHQQIDSCYNIMGIPKSDTAEMTGAMSPADREVAWRERRMFFLTPQVVTNDLSRGICPPEQIKCVVFDEAHKAIGNHAYCQVMKALIPFNREFRVLALSATPGNDMLAVQKVIENLHISHLEMRNEQSLDTAQYTHHRKVDTIVAKIQGYHKEVRDKYMAIVDFYVRRLLQNKVLYGTVSTITKFKILTARENFRKNPPSGMPSNMVSNIESDFAVCMSLFHGLELLTVHGLRSCLRYISGVLEDDGTFSGVKARLSADEAFVQLMEDLKAKLGPLNYAEPEPNNSIIVDPTQLETFICSHPKMEHIRDVVVQHFEMFEQKGETTRVMIFCQYRDTVVEVCHVLSRHRPLVKPMTFIGQSSGKKSRGLSQKQQLMVMKKFRAGGYNTLISTCVGEEGLDIGDVDLIICFDAHNSPIRLIQRMGRTGRKREGRIVMLMTEGKESQKYRQSVVNQNTMNKNLARGERLKLVPNSPRMVPHGLNPRCHQMFMSMPKQPSPKAKKRRSGNQDLRTMLLNQKNSDSVGSDVGCW
ncbi:Fanconi anemia group M protein, partial [Anabrus simplex]|uniref:Fanconi anemia group M protein n=1 Tax=Anabrus simplex TaxID=316456 RepID=UPI0035A2F612